MAKIVNGQLVQEGGEESSGSSSGDSVLTRRMNICGFEVQAWTLIPICILV